MRAISFKNFRKFENFPLMDFAPITIFVGGNNSGKSTTVKAIISVMSFLRNTRIDVKGNNSSILSNNFYFNLNPYAHIGTFQRAKCNKTESNDIYFNVKLEEIIFSLWLNGDGCDENTTYAKLEKLCLEDTRYKTIFEFDFKNNICKMIFHSNRDLFNSDKNYQALCKQIEDLKNRKDSDNTKINRAINKLETQLKDRFPVVEEDFSLEAKLTDVATHRIIGGPLVSGIIYNACYYFMDKQDSNNEIDITKEIEKIKEVQNYFFRFSHRMDMLLYSYPVIEYIYAHAASQIVLYTANDNNYLSKTIHEFANRRLDKDQTSLEFIQKWMFFFEIGQNFKLHSIGGEAHTFEIEGFDGKTTPLADKGMGTIQLMILLLRIALIINERRSPIGQIRPVPITVIVEEPEQNLHPNMQSRLIDFFAGIYEEYKIRFIIETHSEYLIRKSQVLVSEKKYTSQDELNAHNIFKVFYFPKEDVPYPMIYRTDGKFENKFCSGFFDEASRLSFDLF